MVVSLLGFVLGHCQNNNNNNNNNSFSKTKKNERPYPSIQMTETFRGHCERVNPSSVVPDAQAALARSPRYPRHSPTLSDPFNLFLCEVQPITHINKPNVVAYTF